VPLEIALDLEPRRRIDIVDVRAEASKRHGRVLDSFARCLYASHHTTAGYLPQSLAARLSAKPGGVESYLDVLSAVFPQKAGYRHDQMELRADVPADERDLEPVNADSHLAFIAGGLRNAAAYSQSRPGPVYFLDLDGVHNGTPRQRRTTIVGYNTDVEVARARFDVPVSDHPADAINLKAPGVGVYERVSEWIQHHGITSGRVRIELTPDQPHTGLTVNEYETLLMRHDLREVLRSPLRFAADKARHAWNDPKAVPSKALAYARYDLVRVVNGLVDALGLHSSRVESLLARTLEVSQSRFLGMRRSIDLLVSDAGSPGRPGLVEGRYQTPILVQWRPADRQTRVLEVSLYRFE
jgi:thiamine phosphate synthase YjbQ (UPF0047 family)